MFTNQVPRYLVYGVPSQQVEPGFLHVEKVSARKHLHRGKVEAHSHPHINQLTCWTKGRGTYAIESETWHFTAPAIAWLPSGVVHGFEVSPTSDATVLSIADDALPEQRPVNAGFVALDADSETWRALLDVLNVVQRQHASAQQEALAPLAAACLALAASLMQSQTAGRTQSLANRLKAVVDANFRAPLKIDEYVRSLNSTYHLLDKAARERFGISTKQLILERRMLEARRLLKFTIRSAEDIAFELGFEDPAYFNRAFKKHTGLAPIAWRHMQTSANQGESHHGSGKN